MDVRSQVVDIFSAELGVSKDTIKPDSKLAEDLGADSLDTVEITQVLEEKFNVSIPSEDIVKIKTVQDVVDYIGSKMNSK